MEGIDQLGFLSLIVALSAYISGVRLAVIGKMGTYKATKKQKAKWFLISLIPADIGLVASGVLLFLKMFWDDLFGGIAPKAFDEIVVWAFAVAIAVLSVHHLVAWIVGWTKLGTDEE